VSARARSASGCDARRKLGTLIHLRPSVRAVTGSLPAITVDADGRPPADEFDAMLGQAVRTHRAVNLAEVPCRLGDDGEAVLWLSLLPLRAADGQVHVLVTMRDVSTEARVHGRYRELLAEALARAENLERAVEERTRELRAALDEVTRLARTDVLTGLANRRAFTESAEQQLKIAHRHQRSMAVAIVDLESLQDGQRHLRPRRGRRAAADRRSVMSSTVRTTDQVGRLGGEEFGLLFEEVDRDGAWLAADRLRLATSPRSRLGTWCGDASTRPRASGVATSRRRDHARSAHCPRRRCAVRGQARRPQPGRVDEPRPDLTQRLGPPPVAASCSARAVRSGHGAC
jgi:diguanylate cyclase (GGDEF)-like protein